MATKLVCDRCGNVFNNNEGYYVEFYTNEQTSEHFFRYGPNVGRYDLCDNCYRRTKAFVEEYLWALKIKPIK